MLRSFLQKTSMSGSRRAAAGLALAATAAVFGCGPNRPDPAPVAADPQRQLKPGKPLPTVAPASDPNVIVKDMLAAYRALNSYSCRSEAEVTYTWPQPHKEFQSSEMEFTRNPDRVLLKVKDPSSGTRRYVSDGNTLVYYSGVSNQYARVSAARTISGVIRQIDGYAFQLLSPLSFLRESESRHSLSNLRLLRTEPVMGREAYVVSATFDESFMRRSGKTIFRADVKPQPSDCTLWIGKEDGLLLRSRIRVGWSGLTRVQGKLLPMKAAMEINERFPERIVNPEIPADDFRFVAPIGATEVFIESKSQLR